MRWLPGALALSVAALAGCSRPYLTWAVREPLAARRGRLAITVEDRRPGDHASLGRAFGFGGPPTEILLDRDEPRQRLQRLAAEAAVTAGIGLATPTEVPSAQLVLGLDLLRCDGTGLTAHAELSATVAILAPDGSPRLPPDTASLRGKGRGCERAFADVLDQLLDELAARLVEGPAHEAALAVDAPR